MGELEVVRVVVEVTQEGILVAVEGEIDPIRAVAAAAAAGTHSPTHTVVAHHNLHRRQHTPQPHQLHQPLHRLLRRNRHLLQRAGGMKDSLVRMEEEARVADDAAVAGAEDLRMLMTRHQLPKNNKQVVSSSRNNNSNSNDVKMIMLTALTAAAPIEVAAIPQAKRQPHVAANLCLNNTSRGYHPIAALHRMRNVPPRIRSGCEN
mmetsp:Transcript_15154/g.27399  ORF Transcript_15154/g.27399 Transcript_15154/m.27399 type:complete len:205 (+) Transcript_15154:1161-1775(+)